MNSKILVTGFKPFKGDTLNPSEMIVEKIAGNPLIDTLVLPVTFKGSFEVLQKHWNENGPYKGLLMLGQAAGRKTICLERVALNWCESSYADEEQYRPELQKPLIAGAPTSHISEFFPTAWAEELSQIAPTSVSFSAGTYVCNALYFQALNTLKCPSLFVHVPYIPEQTIQKPDMDSIPLDLQIRVVESLLKQMYSTFTP